MQPEDSTTEYQQAEQPIPKTPLRFLLYVSKPHWKWAVAGVFFATIAQALTSSVPYVYKLIIDTAQAVAAGQGEIRSVWLYGAFYIAVVVCISVCWRFSGFISMRWIAGVAETAYNALFAYVTKHSYAYFANRFAGSLSSQIGHAADGAHSLAEGLIWNYYTPILSLSLTTAYLATASPRAAVLFAALIVVLVPLNIFLAKRRRPLVVEYSRRASEVSGHAVDSMTNIAAVRQFVRREHEVASFAKAAAALRASDLRQWFSSEWILAINSAIITLFEAGIMFSVLYLWVQGAVTLGDLVLVFSLLLGVLGELTFIGHSMNGFIRCYGAIQEGLSEVLLPHEIADAPSARALEAYEGKIEFLNVVFQYSDGNREVLSGLSLIVAPGERVGLVGPSGAGKSTFVSLLLRQHDLTSGSILIDAQDISEVTQDSLRSAMAVVPQEPLLFHRSIPENIAYGRPEACEKEIVKVAKMAQAHEFIAALPSGYGTLVGERGVKLSGGQRQRVAIARAMLKQAPILILDEATSSLDSESEVAVQKALHELMKGKTVIAIAHRLSTLREMDRIIVLDDGKVVEDGAPAALLKQGGLYAKLWKHQAGGFLQE